MDSRNPPLLCTKRLGGGLSGSVAVEQNGMYKWAAKLLPEMPHRKTLTRERKDLTEKLCGKTQYHVPGIDDAAYVCISQA